MIEKASRVAVKDSASLDRTGPRALSTKKPRDRFPSGRPPRCREVPAADALRRLAVWGREWTAGRGPITARAVRRVAVLAGRDGAMLEALFLFALDEARGPVGSPPHRPRWVLCAGDGVEMRRGG